MPSREKVVVDATDGETCVVVNRLVGLCAQGDLEVWGVQQARDIRALAGWVAKAADDRLRVLTGSGPGCPGGG